MKARRRVGPDGRSVRTPTVRRIKPAIGGVSRRTPPPMPRPVAARDPGGIAASPAPDAFALDAIGGRPVDLSVDLGRGLRLANPLVAAAGALGYGTELAELVDLPRLGALATRGTSLKPRSGQPSPRTAEVPSGLLLGIGVANPGIDAVLERHATSWAAWAVPVILNLCVESAAELAEVLRRLEDVAGVAGVELNLSCPGSSRGGAAFGLDPDAAGALVAAARRATDLPVIAKLTAAAADVRAVARSVEAAGADAISAINTLPGLAIAADRCGPALGSGYGGVAGPALKPIALRVVWEVAQVVDVPVIGIGGVTTLEDVLDLLAAGASAVGVGSAALADPMLPVRLADELADWCRGHGVARAADLVGTAVPARPFPASTRGAEYGR